MTLRWHQSTVPSSGAETALGHTSGTAAYALPVELEMMPQGHRGRGQPRVTSPSVLESRSLNLSPSLHYLLLSRCRSCLFLLLDSACVPCRVAPSSRPRRGAPLLLSDLCFLPPFLPHTPPPSCFPFNEHLWALAGGPVVKNLPCNAGDMCLMPGQGTNMPQAAEQLSL